MTLRRPYEEPWEAQVQDPVTELKRGTRLENQLRTYAAIIMATQLFNDGSTAHNKSN